MIEVPETFKPYTKPCCSCARPTWWIAADTGNPICLKCCIEQDRSAVNAVPKEVKRALAAAKLARSDSTPAPKTRVNPHD